MGSSASTPLDAAWQLHLGRQDAVGALRRAQELLCQDPRQIDAALLVASCLLTLERPTLAGRFARFALARGCDRGDLGYAVAGLLLWERARGEDLAARRTVAERFGATAASGAPAPPPPLPPKAAPPRPPAPPMSEAKLLARTEEVADALEGAAAEPTREVPPSPLFGQLRPPALRELLATVTLQEAPSGEVILRQGDEGTRAYHVVRGRLEASRGRSASAQFLAEIGPGTLFGEMALVSQAPRAASVVALEPCLLLSLEREALETAARRSPAIARELARFSRRRMADNLLRSSPILSRVAEADRAEVLRRFTPKNLEPGTLLIEEGGETSGLFLIASGAVDVVGRDSDGGEILLAHLGPGDVVGEMGVVLRRPASADVRVVHPTVVLELTREAFAEAIASHPELLFELYDLATKRDEVTRSVVAQQTLDVDEVVLL